MTCEVHCSEYGSRIHKSGLESVSSWHHVSLQKLKAVTPYNGESVVWKVKGVKTVDVTERLENKKNALWVMIFKDIEN